MKQLFQIFERLYSADKFEVALCKKIVEGLSGYIYADSKENDRALFRLILTISNKLPLYVMHFPYPLSQMLRNVMKHLNDFLCCVPLPSLRLLSSTISFLVWRR